MGKIKNLNDYLGNDRSKVKKAKNSKYEDTMNAIANDDSDFKYSGKTTYSMGKRCYESHPPLKLPGTDLVIYGGSCDHPVVKDADIYIGFQSGMRMTARSWPWKKGVEFEFAIPDMGIPKSPEEFKKMVGYVKKQLEEGKKVHCGCIGGHGRTGTFFAALVSEFGEKDAINYVRKNYCDRAVESGSQVKFLNEHYGVTKMKGHKEGLSPMKGQVSTYSGGNGKADNTYAPMKGTISIWGHESMG